MYRLSRTARQAAVLLTGLLTLTAPAAAQDDRVGAAECCVTLLVPIGARAVGLGNALTARRGADALFVNPAGLAGLEQDEFRIHNATRSVETSNTFGVAFGIASAGTVSLSYRLVDYGEDTSRDETGQVTGQFRAIEHMLLATFATHLGQGVSAGVTYKVYQLRLSCSGFCPQPPFAATTHAVDFGVQYHPPLWRALQLGASVIHLGLPLQVINAEQASPLPARLRGGAAYEVLHHFAADSAVAVWLSADVSASWRQGVPVTAGAGVEVIMDNTIFLRAGYATGSGFDAGAAVGVGLRYERFDIGVARSFVEAGGLDRDPFQVTFAVTF